jgi:predicted nucleic acid-binding protein
LIHYLDSSALVKRYVREPGSDAVRSLFRRAVPAVLRLAQAEAAAAICRLAREGAIGFEARGAILARIERDMGILTVVEIRQPVVDHSVTLLARYPLRAYDALQLAGAVLLRDRGATVSFWCADLALLDTARDAGLRVVALR